MDSDLSPQDKKDLDKFIKFFALKTVQVIVQARLGEKVCTRSLSSPTGSDWFNLAIKDIPEVTHESKKALAGQLPGIERSMCVEISLKTSEGDSMELETWFAFYISWTCPTLSITACHYCSSLFVLWIYFGEVQLTGLGEAFQTVRVGVVGTPIGTITLSCAYRTNLAFMSTRQFERTAPIMGIIIDHFVERPFGNVGHMHPCNYRAPGEDEGAYNGVEDSQEVCTTSFSTSPPSQCVFTVHKAHLKTPKPALYCSRLSYQSPVLVGAADFCHPSTLNTANPHQMGVPGKEGGVPQQVPVQPCHGAQAEHRRVSSCPPADHVPATPSSSGEDAETSSRSVGVKSGSPWGVLETTFTRKVGAFVNKPGTQVTTASLDLPFAAFAPRAYDLEENDPMVQPPESSATSSPLQGSLHSQGSGESGGPAQDDFVMVDFKPAFSKDDLLPMDLGTFYREFQNPPQLTSLTIDVSSQSMAEDLDSLPEKLAVYEKNIDEFDAFVDTLQ
uniref:ATG13 autophagy related 13 homolog (S. cerevisiae) n=1 Tax=Oncorhynchus mykiss TaxID=8022 RepID=A0A8C7QCR4_ONCMY